MKQRMNLENARAEGVAVEKTGEGYELTVPAAGGKLIFFGAPMQIGGADWTGMKHLVFDVTAQDSLDQTFTLVFTTPAGPEGDMCIINAGILPRVRTVWPVDLSLLDSQTMFIPRTPGRIKEIVLGRGIRPEDVAAMIVTFRETNYEQHILLHELYLTDEMPDTSLVGAEPIVDSLGQSIHRQWDKKTASLQDMKDALTAELADAPLAAQSAGCSRFGGELAHRYEATGFFHTHFDGERWCLADPEGYRFLSTGLDCCIPGDAGFVEGIESLLSEMPDAPTMEMVRRMTEDNSKYTGNYINFSIWNLIRTFGEDWKQEWMKLTRSRLGRWHFNTIGNWSDKEFIRFARMPYVWPMKDFPTTAVRVFRDFPDVFSTEYEENAEIYSRQLEEFADDEYMIGYFLRNEPEWAFVQGLVIADKVLESPDDTACKQEMIRFLQEKYETIDALNIAWQKDYGDFGELMKPQPPVSAFSEAARDDARAFSEIMIRRYVGVPSEACRRVDANHMNLGMRYAMLLDPILLSGHEYFDVFSLNGYNADCYDMIQKAGEISNKPVLIGEFHFGAPDAGMLTAAICSVATQEDRGKAYRVYYEEGMKSPYFIGAHYFSLNDQPVLGRFDGENCQIGVVDVCHRPYEVFLSEAAKVNEEIYAIADGKRSDPKPEVHRIPRMMGF